MKLKLHKGWVTPSQNVQHSSKTYRIKCKSYNIIFQSTKDAVNWLKQNKIKNSANITTIHHACNGYNKSAYGLFWSYIDEND